MRWFWLLGLVSGCSLAQVGEGKGHLAGALYVKACQEGKDFGAAGSPTAYDMKPIFFVADPIDDSALVRPKQNRLQIRVQSTGNLPEEADVMWISVADVEPIAKLVGQPVDVTYTSNVRATLDLNRTCLMREATPILEGTMTFTSFGAAGKKPITDDFQVQIGEKLAATFHFDVVDERARTLGGEGAVSSIPAVSGQIDGDFEFNVVASRSAQAFP